RGVWRDDTPADLLDRWASFVAECERGYRGDELAYGDEAMPRTPIEAAMRHPDLRGFPEMAGFRRRVTTIDARFQPLLMEHAFPGIDPEEWWLRGIGGAAGGRAWRDGEW